LPGRALFVLAHHSPAVSFSLNRHAQPDGGPFLAPLIPPYCIESTHATLEALPMATMTTPIFGIAPPQAREATHLVVWPTIGAHWLGRLAGRIAGTPLPAESLRILRAAAVAASIPAGLAAFAWMLMPFVARRYKVTNRRVMVLKGLRGDLDRSIDLVDFDHIDIEILPGQAWLHAGDLVFRQGGVEKFRLEGVGRPEVFRASCLKIHQAVVSVAEVLQQQAQPAVEPGAAASNS